MSKKNEYYMLKLKILQLCNFVANFEFFFMKIEENRLFFLGFLQYFALY